jgi:hypothetical protein
MAFSKGESGNLGRKGQDDHWLREIARKYCPDAFKVHIANLEDEDPSVRHKAAEAILNRGYGKPKEEIGLDIQGNVNIKVIVE